MISLDDYINKEENINEGLWQSIKDWFSGLFGKSSENRSKRYYRSFWDDDYSSNVNNNINNANVKNARTLSGAELEDFRQTVKKEFESKKCKILEIKEKNAYNEVISPKGAKPEERTNTGFWKFLNQPFTDKEKHLWHFAVCWLIDQNKDKKADSKKLLDYPALITLYRRGVNVNIIKMQILKEYDNVLNYGDLMKLIEENAPSLFKHAKYVQFFEKNDKDIYQKLINDFNFEHEYNEKLETNIAYLKITKI